MIERSISHDFHFHPGRGHMKAKNPIVIHYVHDMDRAKNFYTRAFDAKLSFESPGWTTLDFGPIELALHILSHSSEPEGRPFASRRAES